MSSSSCSHLSFSLFFRGRGVFERTRRERKRGEEREEKRFHVFIFEEALAFFSISLLSLSSSEDKTESPILFHVFKVKKVWPFSSISLYIHVNVRTNTNTHDFVIWVFFDFGNLGILIMYAGVALEWIALGFFI